MLIEFYEKYLNWLDDHDTLNEEERRIQLDDKKFEKQIPDSIFGCKQTKHGMFLSIKWMNGKCWLVQAAIAKENCSHLVVKFYEEIIVDDKDGLPFRSKYESNVN